MTDPPTFTLALPNETATAHLMADLALLIGPGDVITLSGDLGTGKTAAARAMIRYLAGDDTLEVPSPTFTLAQTYDLPPFPLVHADLYRVNDPAELEEIGLSPLPEDILALIEWPERAPAALPADRIDIALSYRPALGSTARAAEITGHGKAAAQVARLHNAAILHQTAKPDTSAGFDVFFSDIAWRIEEHDGVTKGVEHQRDRDRKHAYARANEDEPSLLACHSGCPCSAIPINLPDPNPWRDRRPA